jgi:hypothetical protein
MSGGAVAGKFEVKSCGKAHAWCAACRPEQAARQRKPERPSKQHDKPCRSCGRCDDCLGLIAPKGMKICRTCGETKPIDRFPRRDKKGNVRNACMSCHNATLKTIRCENCDRQFMRRDGQTRGLCARCRPPLTKPCARCGTAFVGSMDQRRYCSDACMKASTVDRRAAAHQRYRYEALAHYSATPEPSCSCCGETIWMFLALDHIDGGGHEQRKKLGGGGFWAWLRNNDYPPGFRVLCHNCNYGRHLNGGACPHEEITNGATRFEPVRS